MVLSGMLRSGKPFQDAGRKTTPSSGSPIVTKRQSAMISFLRLGGRANSRVRGRVRTSCAQLMVCSSRSTHLWVQTLRGDFSCVSQSVATTAGDQYQLSYWVGNTTVGGIFGTTSKVNVSLNGTLTFSDTNSNVSPTTLNWEQFTHTFVATGSSTALAFANGDPAGDNSNGLDNVVLLDLGPAPPPSVPEPASFGLLAAGLAFFALLRKRQILPYYRHHQDAEQCAKLTHFKSNVP
jgi:hypothetical protein